MPSDAAPGESATSRWDRGPFFSAVIVAAIVTAAVVLAGAAWVAHERTVPEVLERQLLPRWDHASHLLGGWIEYHHLAQGQVHRFLLHVWQQGYWPPFQCLYLVPFYAALGPTFDSGLTSSSAALVLLGLAGATLLVLLRRSAAPISVPVFVSFAVTSPFYLAYSTVAMQEMLGALMLTLVLLGHVWHQQRRSTRSARFFALALTLLFFTKYNYFLLAALPIVTHEWMERTAGCGFRRRWQSLGRLGQLIFGSWTGRLLTLYALLLVVVRTTGGFDFQVGGVEVHIHSIGASGHIVLYALLARLWYLHHRRRLDWRQFFAKDLRLRPLFLLFVLPVVVWLGTPYPNHLRDFWSLVVNVRMDQPTSDSSLVFYLRTLRSVYSPHGLVALAGGCLFLAAAVRGVRQSGPARLLPLAAAMQLAFLALHHTRAERFLLLAMVPFWLAAAAEVGALLSRSRALALLGTVGALVLLAFAGRAVPPIVATESFRRVAFEDYTESRELNAAFASVRGRLSPRDRLAILGKSDALSPALCGWQLGPPAGDYEWPESRGPGNLGKLDEATHMLWLVPTDPERASPEIVSRHEAYRAGLAPLLEGGSFELQDEFSVPSRHLVFRLYARPAATSS